MIERIFGAVLMVSVTIYAWVGLLRNDIYGVQDDKRKHLIISAIIAVLIGSITFFTHNALWYFIGAGVAFLIGVAKELADKYLHTGTFEFGDLLADFVGSFVLAPLTLFSVAFILDFFI